MRTPFLFLVFLSVAFGWLLNAALAAFFLFHLQGKFLLKVLYKLGGLEDGLSIWVVLSEPNPSGVVGGLEVFGAAFAEHLKPEYLRLIVIDLGRDDHCRRVMLQEDVRQVRPEEAPIQVDVAAPTGQVPIRHVGFLAAGAVNLDPAGPLLVSHP